MNHIKTRLSAALLLSISTLALGFAVPVQAHEAHVHRMEAATSNSGYPLVKISHGDGSSDYVPDLAAKATVTVLYDGNWSHIFAKNPPGKNDIVLIPQGVTVTYDEGSTPRFEALAVKGNFVMSPSKSTKLTTGTVMLYDGGSISIAPQNASITSEIVFDGTVNAATSKNDPSQMLLGLVAMGGTVNIEGSPVATTFSKVTGAEGSTKITASSATGWKAGDEIVLAATSKDLPDPTFWKYSSLDSAATIPFPNEYEVATISSVSGNVISLSKPLAYDHDGYAANFSRNVVLRSMSTESTHRAHALFTGSTDVKVRNARFFDFGRTTIDPLNDVVFDATGKATRIGTNQRGRYVMHLHHLTKPFTIDGNAITGSIVADDPLGNGVSVISGSNRWGIVNHGSFGSISKNAIVGTAGSGIMTEQGTETGTIDGNIVIGIGRGTGLTDDELFGKSNGSDVGHGGFGFWFRGPFVEVTNNVAAGYFRQAGFTYFTHPLNAPNTLPSVAGMPSDLKGKKQPDLITRNGIRLFDGNVIDGYFGYAGLLFFYNQAGQTVKNLTLNVRSEGGSYGIVDRFTKSVNVIGSTLTGGKNGTAVEMPHSESLAGPVTFTNSTVTNFKK